MVLDAERCLLAVKDEVIFLSPTENAVLDLIIQNKYRGISGVEITEKLYPYYGNPYRVISLINKKMQKYGQIYSEHKRYKLQVYIQKNIRIIKKWFEKYEKEHK